MAKPQEHLGFVPSPPPAESTTRTSHLHVGFEQIQRSPSRMVIYIPPSGRPELFVLTGPITSCIVGGGAAAIDDRLTRPLNSAKARFQGVKIEDVASDRKQGHGK